MPAKTWVHAGIAMCACALLIGAAAAGRAQSNSQVRLWLGTPTYTAGQYRVPLDYTWRSTSDFRLARLKIDFMPTGGWLTGGRQEFGRIHVLVPTNSGWSVEKPLGVTSNYAFDYNGKHFSGTWGSHLLVLRNDETLNQMSFHSGGTGTGVLGFLANPWVLAGIVAAAIAIPLATAAEGDDAQGYYDEGGADVTTDPGEVVIDPLSLTSIRQGPGERAVIRWVALTGLTYTTYVQTQGLSGAWAFVSSNLVSHPPENTWTDKVPRASPAFFRVGGTIPP